jgi:DNA-nicking Smr family endonuclease
MSRDWRDRPLRDDEDALWRGVAKSIRPLRTLRASTRVAAERAAPPPAAKSAPAVVSRTPAPQPLREPAKAAPALAVLDRRTRQKLARGRENIDARIDLHGMTQAEAYSALLRFLHRVQDDGAKFVIVVTGKGARGATGERGVLRRQVPLWLSLPEFRVLVVSFEAAHIGHGGDGALYVRIRRGR